MTHKKEVTFTKDEVDFIVAFYLFINQHQAKSTLYKFMGITAVVFGGLGFLMGKFG